MAGDEEEDGVDDLENEFSFDGRSRHDLQHAVSADSMLHGHMSYGRASSVSSDFHNDLHPMPQLPLLTNGQMVLLILHSNPILAFGFHPVIDMIQLMLVSCWWCRLMISHLNSMLWFLRSWERTPEAKGSIPCLSQILPFLVTAAFSLVQFIHLFLLA